MGCVFRSTKFSHHWNLRRKFESIILFSIISQHWDDGSGWNSSSQTTRTKSYCIINIPLHRWSCGCFMSMDLQCILFKCNFYLYRTGREHDLQNPWGTLFIPTKLPYLMYRKHCVEGLKLQTRSLGPFYWHGLNFIPAWINSHIPCRVWDKITFPFPNFNGITAEDWEWMSKFIPHFPGCVIPYPYRD